MVDHEQEYFPIGASVQIAFDSQRDGAFRVIAHSAGNLPIERGSKISKWPKCKTRLVNLENNDAMGQVPIPLNARAWARRKRWLDEEHPEEYQPSPANLPGQEIHVPETVDLRDAPVSEEDLINDAQRTLEAPEQDGYGGDSAEDGMEIGVVFDGNHPGHGRPETTYVNHGAILCERITDIPLVNGSTLPILHIIAWGRCFIVVTLSMRFTMPSRKQSLEIPLNRGHKSIRARTF